MKLTNKKNLPRALFDAVNNDSYSKGDSDFSVTELLQPPKVRALRLLHQESLEEDVSDRLWSLYGQIAHLILERANVKDLAEKRFFALVDNYKISGQVDSLSLEDGILSDWKFTTSYGFMKDRDPKEEWVAQLNMQHYLIRRGLAPGVEVDRSFSVEGLRIVGLLRDWQIREANKSLRYPQAPVAIQPIPMWSLEQTEDFIRYRISLHKAAEKELPECSKEETWSGKRCQSYCPVVNFCTQFNQKGVTK